MDHISIPIRDVTTTRDFYDAVLAPLGWQRSGFREDVYVGYKKPGSPALYFTSSNATSPVHLAFKASTTEEVAQFYHAALDTGGQDNGPPGPRPAYGKNYYAAFVYDPDGHNIEAVMGGVG